MTKKSANPKRVEVANVPTVKPEQPAPEKTQAETSHESQLLKQEVERLRAIIAAGPETIQDKIKYYQHKQELIERLQSLEATEEILANHLEEINKEAEQDLFLSEQYKLNLTVKSGYSGEKEILTFRHPVIITEMLLFLIEKVSSKKQNIESEISK